VTTMDIASPGPLLNRGNSQNREAGSGEVAKARHRGARFEGGVAFGL
jgi:hypothetical protein